MRSSWMAEYPALTVPIAPGPITAPVEAPIGTPTRIPHPSIDVTQAHRGCTIGTVDIGARFNQKYSANPQLFNTPPLPVVVKAAEALEGGRVLELGVGNGRNAKYLLDESLFVTGVDSSQEGLRVLRGEVGDNSNLELICDDVMGFLTDEQYDLVVATGLLHFLDAADIDKLLDKMTAWTKPGAINAVAVRMTQNPPGNLPHVFDRDELRSMYEQVGWSIEYYHEADKNDHRVASIIARKP